MGFSASFHLFLLFTNLFFIISPCDKNQRPPIHPTIHPSLQPLSGVLQVPLSSPAPHFPWLPVPRPAVPDTLSLLPPPRSSQSSNTPPGPPLSPHPGQNTNFRPSHLHFLPHRTVQPHQSQHHQSRALPPRGRQALNPSWSHPFRKCLHPLIILNCLNVRRFYLLPQHSLLQQRIPQQTCPLLSCHHPLIPFHRPSWLPTPLSFYPHR